MEGFDEARRRKPAVEVLRLLLHEVGVRGDVVGIGDILALRGVDAPWGVDAVGVSAVRRAVHRGAIVVPRLIHAFEDITAISPGREEKYGLRNSRGQFLFITLLA